MKTKKVIALILILAMLAAILISCGETTDDPDGNDGANADNPGGASDGEGEEEPRIEPDLPEIDFEGYTFTFLSLETDSDDWPAPTPLELVTTEEDDISEPIQDAVFRRNQKIMGKYNFDIRMVAIENYSDALRRAVGAGEIIYDAVLMYNNDVQTIVPNGLLIDIEYLTHLNRDKPWWDPAVNAMSVDGKNFLLGGDLLILDNEATNSLLFNKKLMADLGMDLPYDLVKENKWTMDIFNEYIKGASHDLNGDGQMTWQDDRWGFVTFNDTLHSLLVSGGGTLAMKDENDIPFMTITSPRNLSVMDKVFDIMYNKDDTLNVQSDVRIDDWTPAFYNSFLEDRALFQWARIRAVAYYRGMESDFGILPMPKFDELQANYHSVVNSWTGGLLGVPKSADNFERISIILEALAAESKYTLQPAYYEVALQRKHARDEESGEMLDIIFNSRVYDIGAFYSFNNVFEGFITLCNRSNRDIVSWYDRISGRIETAIDRVVSTFQGMD